MKQSFWELVCFWDRGAVRASGLAGGAPSPGQPGGEGNLRESPRLAASFSCSDPPKEPRGESVPPPSAQQAPAHSGLLPDPQETHRLYRVKLEELTKLQNSCTSSIARQKKQLQELALVLKKLGPSPPPRLPKPPVAPGLGLGLAVRSGAGGEQALTAERPRAWLLPSCPAGVRCHTWGDPCADSGFRGPTYRCKPSLQWGAKEAAQELENQIKERQGLFFDMEAYLPKKNG